jgi:hypothetical protein
MTDFLKSISENANWWHGIIATGAAGFVACAAARWPEAAMACAGFALFGFGQWIDHPTKTGFINPGMGIPPGLLTGQPWSPSWMGNIISIAGIGMIALALVRWAFW